MPKRMSRAERAEENRRALLVAAQQEFEELGYHGASLDGIAEAAGFSKGAVYSRFDSKDDLFLAVVAERIAQRHDATAQLFDDPAGVDLPAVMAAALHANLDSAAWQAALLEFRAHAWRHPEVNRRYAALHQATIESIAGYIAETYRSQAPTPPRQPALMAVVALALGTGVVAEYLSNPDLDVTSVIEALTQTPSGVFT